MILLKRKKLKRARFLILAVSLSLVFVYLIGRLVYLMSFQGAQLGLMALSKWTKTIDIAPKRGSIVDRNGSELVLSVEVYRVDADPSVLKKYIEDKHLSEDTVATQLSKILGMDKNQLVKLIDRKDSNGKPAQFISLKRQVEKEAVDSMKALKLNGILISSDKKRYYPNQNFLSQVLGHTNAAGDGISGVELSYNDILKGMPGIKVLQTDAYNNDLPYSEAVVVDPVDGQNIKLTIYEKIQELAKRVAKETLEVNKAKSVSITIMNPKNGDILGMVNYPEYDPNDPNKAGKTDNERQEAWKNRAMSNIFEPGSIFKVITSAAALQNNSVKATDRFVCKGTYTVPNTTITLQCDDRVPHGIQTFSDIIKNSCNVGFILLGEKIGKDKFYNYISTMGFGQKSGVDLPGESTGIVFNAKTSGPVEFATNSYGQGIAVTQIQYMAAFNAVANGGTWIRPHVLQQIYHTDSNDKTIVDKKYDDFGKKTVLDKDKAAQLRIYLERVVTEGTSTATIIPGYHIAGKTGTARKVKATGGYEDGKYISSFTGMAPTNDPQVTLIVTVEEPSGKYYASETAVPAARKLFVELFPMLNIAPDSSAAAN